MPSTPKQSWLLYVFAVALLTDLMVVQLELQSVRYISKSLLMMLMLVFVGVQPYLKSRWKNLLLAALFFSLGGDVFLLFDSKNSLFFILGLLSFLIAHVFYCVLFLRLKKHYYARNNWNLVSLLALALYVSALFFLLYPHLGNLKLPVLLYALVLSAMFYLALHVNSGFLGNPTIWMGAFLFVVSDSLLAINKFYHPFPGAPVLVMLTYALAQLLIVTGVIKLIRSRDMR